MRKGAGFDETEFLKVIYVSFIRFDEIPNLSARQLAIFLTLYGTDEQITVRAMAKLLNVDKSIVTRAFDRLTEHGLLRRRRDQNDRRSITAVRTYRGMELWKMLESVLLHAKDGKLKPPVHRPHDC